jgi:peptidoglycan/LPS O-acetylase OafA/YrhL
MMTPGGGLITKSSAVHTRIQGLDLLRGLAILLVLIRHSWPDLAGNAGIVGVVAFFTLSGYLITGLLIADVRRNGRVSYGRFYRNRAIRLLPALVFLLIGFVIVEGVLDVSGTKDQVLNSLAVAITYTMNIPGFPHGSDNLSHLWTLANEEQFYIVWPLIIFLGIRFNRLRLVLWLAAGAILLGLVGTIHVASPDVFKVYTLPTAWTLSMVIGAAARVGEARLSRLLAGLTLNVAAVIALVGLLGISVLPEAKNSPFLYLIGGPLIAALTVVLIWKLRGWTFVPAGLVPLVWLGTISYAAYLWNYPMGWWLRDVGVDGAQWWAVLLTILMATVSWFAVEAPFNALKKKLDARTPRRVPPVVEREPLTTPSL